jgi:hypothetical protein
VSTSRRKKMTLPILPDEIHAYISELNKRILPRNAFLFRWVKQQNILQCSIFNDSADETSQMNFTESMKNLLVTKLQTKTSHFFPLAIDTWYHAAKNWTIRMSMDGGVSQWTDFMFLDLTQTMMHEICNCSKWIVLDVDQKTFTIIQTCTICFHVGKPTGEILNKCYRWPFELTGTLIWIARVGGPSQPRTPPTDLQATNNTRQFGTNPR